MLFNADRAREQMRRHGLDLLVASSPVNVNYFSEYFAWVDPIFKEYMMAPGASSNLTPSFAVAPLEGEPALVLQPFFAVNAPTLCGWEVRSHGKSGMDLSFAHDDGSPAYVMLPEALRSLYEAFASPPTAATPVEALANLLRDRGLATARIGIELEGLPPATREALTRALPGAALKDASNLIRFIRMVKTDDELRRLARAAEIAERAATASFALARPGRPVADLVACFRAAIAAEGADFDHYAYGLHGMGIAMETPHDLHADDVLYVDFGCIYRHAFSDSGTTLALRPLSPELRRRFDAVRAGMDAGIAALRPGARASQVQAAMQGAMVEHGVTGSFPHGHGMGLEVRDYPILVPDNGLRLRDDCIDLPSDLTIEAGMVINLEAPLFMPGVASLHSEQTFVVTEHGCEPLVLQARSEPVIGGE